jgi:hypothetical protein
MARTFIRQDTQVRKSDTYDDTIAPTLANFETNAVSVEDDLNSVRSQLHNLLKNQAGNWYDDLNIPSALDTGTQRGVNDLNTDLHANERKRILRRRQVIGAGIGPIATNAQHAILDAAGELPGNTTIAVGSVTTLGTVAAYEASFDTATLTEVAGGDALTPKNLVKIADSATGDIITDGSGREVHGLLQSESNTDGHTATTTTPNRLQLSFVVHNATNDDLELAAQGVMDGKTVDYSPVERYAFEDIPEHAWLSDTDFIDAGAGAVTRQQAYNNQGVTPVDLGTNAILDLEAAGIYWEIRDDLEATLFRITEGSAGGTTEVAIESNVDTFRVDAVDNDFDQGVKVDTGGTEIDIGVTAGHVETTGANNLHLQAGGEMLLDDTNQTGSTWAQTDGIKLSETTAEWDNFETQFGEVSLLNAIYQAASSGARGTKTYANVTVTTVANNDVGGVAGGANLDAQLPDMSGGSFLTDYDVFLNGDLLRPGADAAANNDYYPGTSLLNGQLKFEFQVVINDVLCVIPYA